jgi:cell division protein FtsN
MTSLNTPRHPALLLQRGGFAIGLIVGLLIGLMLALGVALYITKAPMPFMDKVPHRTAGQDAAEIEKNKNWDPNSPLYGKNPAKPGSGNASNGSNTATAAASAPTATATGTLPPPSSAMTLPGSVSLPQAKASSPSPASSSVTTARPRDPASILADVPADLSADNGPDPFTYFVQAGAFVRPEDAEQQRARLAMLGLEARLTEREQSGRTMYRVRIGPFTRKGEAETAKAALSDSGIESALVRVQR